MSKLKMPNAELNEPTSSEQSEIIDTARNNTAVLPYLPTGLKLPQPLNIKGHLAANWKRFKRAWDNYAWDNYAKNKSLRPGIPDPHTFLSVIGEESLEIIKWLDFAD